MTGPQTHDGNTGSGGHIMMQPFTLTHAQEIWRAPLWQRPFLWLLGKPTRTVEQSTYLDCSINSIHFGDGSVQYDFGGTKT